MDPDFILWNEEMVRRYDIDAYYRGSHPAVRWVERKRIGALVSLLALRPGETVLEVGCGAGHVLQRFEGEDRVGLDLSSTMLERARGRLGPEVSLVRASADRLPFPDAAFSAIVCTELLEHTPDPGAVLHELFRVAGDNGRVVVSIPDESNIDRVKRIAARMRGLSGLLTNLADENNEWHLHRMNMSMLRSLTGGDGRVERLRRVPFPLLPLRYVALLRRNTPACGEEPGDRPESRGQE